ncbi:hypothetical protein I4U23_022139 [Adineta vaga]|nr:hypothetical protein I4U23_022139 [Adineta vaga]
MGSQVSQYNSSSYHRSRQLYEACLSDDLQTVESLLPTMTSSEINRIDPHSGKTSLQVACSLNHVAIIKVLLQNSSVFRSIANRQGRTAAEELPTTASEDIRSLFARPCGTNASVSRFLETTHPNNIFRIRQRVSNDPHSDYENIETPNDWLCGYDDGFSATVESQFMSAIARAPKALKYLLRYRTEIESREHLNALLNRTLDRKSHEEALHLYDEFTKKGRIDLLLTLYTLETPLYGMLQSNANAYTALLFLHLSELSDRAFMGQTYRGAKMQSKDIDAYRWAAQSQQSVYVLETRTIQSTSKKKNVAESFAKIDIKKGKSDLSSVLLMFHFTTKCCTAIDLTRINDHLPALSIFPGEEEVLLLPFTLFKVNSIEVDTQKRQYFINLVNVPVPKISLISSWNKLNN